MDTVVERCAGLDVHTPEVGPCQIQWLAWAVTSLGA